MPALVSSGFQAEFKQLTTLSKNAVAAGTSLGHPTGLHGCFFSPAFSSEYSGLPARAVGPVGVGVVVGVELVVVRVLVEAAVVRLADVPSVVPMALVTPVFPLAFKVSGLRSTTNAPAASKTSTTTTAPPPSRMAGMALRCFCGGNAMGGAPHGST